MPTKKKGASFSKKGPSRKKKAKKPPKGIGFSLLGSWVVRGIVFFAVLLVLVVFWDQISSYIKSFVCQRIPEKSIGKQQTVVSLDPALFIDDFVNSALFQLNISRSNIVKRERKGKVLKVCVIELPGKVGPSQLISRLKCILKDAHFRVIQSRVPAKRGFLTKVVIVGPKSRYPLYELLLTRKVYTEEVKRVRVAIIIDDIGYNISALQRLISIHEPITFSVLPDLPNTRRAIRVLKRANSEIMLHIPMEPNGYPHVNPGMNALLLSMTEYEISNRILHFLRQCPGACGANNHMGSRFTQEVPKMREVLQILKEKGLFFIDSRTTDKSVCKRVARDVGILFASRDVFIDDRQEEEYISSQLDRLVHKAEEKGYAIGIGHPYEATIRVLEGRLPLLSSNRISLVKVSTLVKQVN